jgi:hypothetical protein
MLHLLTVLALASSVAAAPAVSPAPAPSADASLATHSTTAMVRSQAPGTAPRRPQVELPAWTHYLTVGQQNAAMRAELDAEFNIDHSP